MRFVLASASQGRLATLRDAGLDPEVIVSGVDETDVPAEIAPADLVLLLARRKSEAVAASVGDRGSLVLGCDSMLELAGEIFGKPGTPDIARERWKRMRGRHGLLHTGHHLISTRTGRAASATGSTKVQFADVTDAEIDAYIATGEPLNVAGGFTIDSLGGAFVERIEGDPHNVVGVSLPLLRQLLATLDVAWPSLWAQPASPSPS